MTKLPRTTTFAAVLSLLLLGLAWARAQQPMGEMEASIFPPEKIEWLPGPPSLPAGAHFAVLEGDPAKEGPFTMRVRLPDGFKIPPHTHPKTEHVTVISGTFNFGYGPDLRPVRVARAARRHLRPLARGHAALRVGQGRDRGPAPRRRPLGHHLRQPRRRPAHGKVTLGDTMHPGNAR